MRVFFALLLTLLCPAFSASAQTEVPAEIPDALRKVGGPYAIEAWRELSSPGTWLLENQWMLVLLLSLLVWTVVGWIAWQVITEFVLTPLKARIPEGTRERFENTVGRIWSEGPASGQALMLDEQNVWIFAIALFFFYGYLTDDAKKSEDAWLGFIAAIVGLGFLARILWEVGHDAYKTITAMSQTGSSVEYPYRLGMISLGFILGVVGLVVLLTGHAIEASGESRIKSMEVLIGGAIRAVGGLTDLLGIGLLIFSARLLIGPILHVLAVLVMWPVVVVLKKDTSEVSSSNKREGL